MRPISPSCRSYELGNRGFDEMSKLYSALLLIALLFAMAGLGMAISMAITEVHHLIASTDNPRGMSR